MMILEFFQSSLCGLGQVYMKVLYESNNLDVSA